MIYVAELSINHLGTLNIAKAMIKAAKDSRADFVKIKIKKVDKYYSQKPKKFGDVGSGKVNFNTRGRRTKKIVYDIYSIPTPLYLNVTYEIKIRTRYQEQMNQILTPFMTYAGAVTQFIIEHGQHKYEAFFDSNFTFDNNVSDLGEDERIYNTTITINVLGYIFGEGKNRDRPHFSRRENPVEIVLPTERVQVGDIPDWTDRSFFRGGEAVTVTHGTHTGLADGTSRSGPSSLSPCGPET